MNDEAPLATTRTPCPPWCDGFQCQESNPGDRFHQRVHFLPVILRFVRATRTGTITATPTAAEASAALFTSAIDEMDETWIAVELGEYGRGVTISAESAARLHQALGELLGMLDLPPADPRH